MFRLQKFYKFIFMLFIFYASLKKPEGFLKQMYEQL